VDLALTRRGDYAVRAALCLAKAAGDGRYVKIREVAGTMALPASYTPQALRLLAEAGLADLVVADARLEAGEGVLGLGFRRRNLRNCGTGGAPARPNLWLATSRGSPDSP
jgi:hypothetical protein